MISVIFLTRSLMNVDFSNPAEIRDMYTFKAIIKQLELKDGLRWHNPTLAQHFASVEALALSRDIIAGVNDDTLPDPELINSAESLLEQFGKMAMESSKRKAVDTPAPPAKKKSAKPTDENLRDVGFIKNLIKEDQVFVS